MDTRYWPRAKKTSSSISSSKDNAAYCSQPVMTQWAKSFLLQSKNVQHSWFWTQFGRVSPSARSLLLTKPFLLTLLKWAPRRPFCSKFMSTNSSGTLAAKMGNQACVYARKLSWKLTGSEWKCSFWPTWIKRSCCSWSIGMSRRIRDWDLNAGPSKRCHICSSSNGSQPM